MANDFIRKNPLVLVSLVIAIIGTASTIAVFYSLNSWLKGLESWMNDLQNNIDGLRSYEIQQLLSNVQQLRSDIASLNSTEIQQLRSADVQGSFQDPYIGYTYTHQAIGVVINFGTESASNVKVTLKWSLTGGGYHEEIINYSSIPGRGIKQVFNTYSFTGKTDNLSFTITWD